MSQDIQASPVTIGEANWQKRAACRGLPPGVFHPDFEDPYYDQRVEEAKAICAQCTVRTECRRYRKDHQIKFGVWAGSSEDERLKKKPLVLLERRRTCLLLNEMYTQKGGMPNRDELTMAAKRHALLGRKAISRNFGSLTVAKDVAGLMARAEADRMMRCIVSLAELREKLGRDITSDDVRAESKRNKDFPGLETIRYTLGIHVAFRQAGNKVARSAPRRSRKQLLSDFVELCREEGRLLEPRDIKEICKYGDCAHWSTYIRNFGSYEALILEAKSILEAA